MNAGTDLSQINALDPRGLSNLQRLAKNNDPQAIKEAARQFEALFLQLVLKSMREASPKSDLFDSEQTRLYESLLDQQMAQVMAHKRGVGLAAVIERQMTRGGAVAPAAADGANAATVGIADAARAQSAVSPPLYFHAPPATAPAPAPAAPPAVPAAAEGDNGVPAHVRAFVSRVLPDANAAAEETGIPAPFLIAHAALESGWGRFEARRADGSPSHNLFGIKAGAGWTGERVAANTVEYVQGLAQQRRETFRAYGSYAESFADYARLLADNPRYAGVLGATDASAFAGGLQRAGYATDPAYASKLRRVIETASQALTS